jgi:hypothetical protein
VRSIIALAMKITLYLTKKIIKVYINSAHKGSAQGTYFGRRVRDCIKQTERQLGHAKAHSIHFLNI